MSLAAVESTAVGSSAAGVAAGEEHPLQFAYTFWFMRRTPGARSMENYEKNIKRVGTFKSVEEFWTYYNHLIRPNDLPNTSDYHLFKEGIKPVWEDAANRRGGKWIVRLKKGLASRYWEDLIIGLVGGQYGIEDGICGAVVSLRYQEDIISVWNSDAADRDACMRIRDITRKLLKLPEGTTVEYKRHDDSLRDNSSFRNTQEVV